MGTPRQPAVSIPAGSRWATGPCHRFRRCNWLLPPFVRGQRHPPRLTPAGCERPAAAVLGGEPVPDRSAADNWTACGHRRRNPDHVRDRFQLSSKCPGDETGWAIAGGRPTAVCDTPVRGRNARLRRALSDQFSCGAVTGWTATLRSPGHRDPLRKRRSVQPDGECRFRVFVRWCRDLCAAGKLTAIDTTWEESPLVCRDPCGWGCQEPCERTAPPRGDLLIATDNTKYRRRSPLLREAQGGA